MINQGQEYQYFKDKISHLEREVSRLSPYEYEHRLLKDVIADCLLQGQITVSELPQAIRLIQGDDLFTPMLGGLWKLREIAKQVSPS